MAMLPDLTTSGGLEQGQGELQFLVCLSCQKL